MDPIVLTLLTLVANALVTGVLLFLFQRKIDASYSRKLEEYRSSLQNDSFAQQARFSQIYTNRVETLKNLYQKFVIFEDALLPIVSNATVSLKTNFRHESTYNKDSLEDMRSKYHELRNYYHNNELFLSDFSVIDVWKVVYDSGAIQAIIGIIAFTINDNHMKSVPDAWLDMLPDLEEIEEFEGADLSDPQILLKRLSLELGRHSRKLQTLYKDAVQLKREAHLEMS